MPGPVKNGNIFADGVKLRIWRWEDAPALLVESQGSLKEGGSKVKEGPEMKQRKKSLTAKE